MAEDPEDRFSNATEFLDALLAIYDQVEGKEGTSQRRIKTKEIKVDGTLVQIEEPAAPESTTSQPATPEKSGGTWAAIKAKFARIFRRSKS